MKITIKSLKANLIIGTMNHERMYPQPIEIDLEFEYDAGNAIENDDFIHAVDYKALTDEIIEHVISTKFYLIETLVSMIINKLKANKQISSGKVTIRKLKALKNAEFISIEGTF